MDVVEFLRHERQEVRRIFPEFKNDGIPGPVLARGRAEIESREREEETLRGIMVEGASPFHPRPFARLRQVAFRDGGCRADQLLHFFRELFKIAFCPAGGARKFCNILSQKHPFHFQNAESCIRIAGLEPESLVEDPAERFKAGGGQWTLRTEKVGEQACGSRLDVPFVMLISACGFFQFLFILQNFRSGLSVYGMDEFRAGLIRIFAPVPAVYHIREHVAVDAEEKAFPAEAVDLLRLSDPEHGDRLVIDVSAQTGTVIVKRLCPAPEMFHGSPVQLAVRMNGAFPVGLPCAVENVDILLRFMIDRRLFRQTGICQGGNMGRRHSLRNFIQHEDGVVRIGCADTMLSALGTETDLHAVVLFKIKIRVFRIVCDPGCKSFGDDCRGLLVSIAQLRISAGENPFPELIHRIKFRIRFPVSAVREEKRRIVETQRVGCFIPVVGHRPVILTRNSSVEDRRHAAVLVRTGVINDAEFRSEGFGIRFQNKLLLFLRPLNAVRGEESEAQRPDEIAERGKVRIGIPDFDTEQFGSDPDSISSLRQFFFR